MLSVVMPFGKEVLLLVAWGLRTEWGALGCHLRLLLSEEGLFRAEIVFLEDESSPASANSSFFVLNQLPISEYVTLH